jgi:hypothetical protein
MKKALLLTFVLGWALCLAGCGRGSSGTNQSPAADVADVLKKAGPESPEVLTELTGAVHRCWNAQGKIPQTLDQVVAAGYLKQIPTLPAGKHYAIDPKGGQVYVTAS